MTFYPTKTSSDSTPSVSKVLHELPEESLVEIDGGQTQHLHPDVLELIQDFADTAHTRDIEVLLTSIPESDSDRSHPSTSPPATRENESQQVAPALVGAPNPKTFSDLKTP